MLHTMLTGLLISSVLVQGYLSQATLAGPKPRTAFTRPGTPYTTVKSGKQTKASWLNAKADANLIRVGISDDELEFFEYPSATLSSAGLFQLIDESTGKVIQRFGPWQGVKLRVDALGFYWRHGSSPEKGPFAGPLRFQPLQGNKHLRIPSITRKGKIPSYRGEFQVTRGFSSPTKLSVVNVLPMKDYLRAVVPNELPLRFGLEAVKAQAVAARNYALRPRTKPWPQFDICDSQYCQAYYGQHTEQAGVDGALTATEGLVALYQGEPILALYSSSHGGHGEDYANAFSDQDTHQFPGTDLPYLRGHYDVETIASKQLDLTTDAGALAYWGKTHWPSFDTKSSYYRWRIQWTRWGLQQILKETLPDISSDRLTSTFITPHVEAGEDLGTLTGLIVTKRGRSGKAMELLIQSTTGQWRIQKEFVIRKALQRRRKRDGKLRMIPSANIAIKTDRNATGTITGFQLLGGGFGHGVGMSQYGASRMHALGYPFDQILKHYYTGIQLGSIPLHPDTKRSVSTHFRVPRTKAASKGVLHVQYSGTPQRLTVSLNGRAVEAPGTSTHHRLAVKHLLKPSQLNQLRIQPTETNDKTTVWVEVL